NFLRQRTVEVDQRAVHAEQLLEPRALRRITSLRQRQLSGDEVECVDADAELERVVSLDLRDDLVPEQIPYRLDQFGGRRFVLHVISLAEQVTAASRFPFPTGVALSPLAPSDDPGRCGIAASCGRT